MSKELAQLSWFTGSRYEVVRSLGQGPIGWAVLALDRELEDTPVALKIVFPQFAADRDMLERLRAQLVVSRQLAHENIAKVHDLDQGANGHPLIASEWIRGVSLEQLIAQERQGLPADESVRIVAGIFAGLAYAHRRGAIHGNLKPSNIFISEAGTVRLADFGLAEVVSVDSGLTRTGQSPRHPLYSAPEQFVTDAPSVQADLYVAGVILYELLSGSPLLPSRDYFSLAEAHRSTPPPLESLAPNTPGWLVNLLRSLLEKEPSSRPQSADAVVQLLSSSGCVPGAKLGNRTMAFARRPPERRARRWITIGIVLVLLIGLGYVLRKQGRTRRWAAYPIFAAEYMLGQTVPGSEAMLVPLKKVFGIKGSAASYTQVFEDISKLDVNELHAIWTLGFPRQLRDDQGRTLLHRLAEKDSKVPFLALNPLLGELLERDSQGRTPLFLSILNHRTEDIHHLAARTVPLNSRDKSGRTPLHYAVDLRQKFISFLLVSCGASASEADMNGDTPVHIIARHGFAELLPGMVDSRFAMPPIANIEGDTPLTLALAHPYPLFQELAAILITDASVRARNPLTGETPLMVAVRHATPAHVKLLLQSGAPPDSADDEGMTALSYSALLCKREMAELLIESGATDIPNRKGSRARDIARSQGCEDVAQRLESVRSTQ